MTLRRRRARLAACLCLSAVLTPIALAGPALAAPTDSAPASPAVTLQGRAVLPASTTVPGPTSGRFIAPTNGAGPFPNAQPVQGFSAILPSGNGTFMAMSDNGFGSQTNSADFLLRVDRLRPTFRTATAPNAGGVELLGSFTLKDPDNKVPFTITREFTDRVLTGADFDIESMQRTADGTLWFGDEFGPYLLHTSASGRLLEAPIPLPDGLRAPQTGHSEEATVLRTMNALRDRAESFAAPDPAKPLVVSPSYQLLADGTTDTAVPNRVAPPAGSGLRAASSEIVDPAALLAAGFPTVPYTVNTQADIDRLLTLRSTLNGVSRYSIAGLISDRPDLVYSRLRALRSSGTANVFNADGTIDRTKFDLQAHRSGRGLKPENTLGAVEGGLNALATTLEGDNGITKDGVLVVSHDPFVNASKCRFADPAAGTYTGQTLIKDLTLRELQTRFVCDKDPDSASIPAQSNDPAGVPIARAYATSQGLQSPFVIPTQQQVFDFTTYYAERVGDVAKAANARRVHFNVETKTNPRAEFASRTASPAVFADSLGQLITDNDLTDRADIQSFDFRELLLVQRLFPAIQTVYLLGDFPVYADGGAGTDDGTNLQPDSSGNTPWLGGLRWPYRETAASTPFRVKTSGGLEGMALSPDGTKLYPMIEQALVGSDPRTSILEFDIASRSFTGKRWLYRFADDAKGTGFSIGEFLLLPTTDGRLDGLVLERAGGDAATQFRRLYEVALGAPGTEVTKRLVVDEQSTADPAGLADGEGRGTGGGRFAMPFPTIESVVALSPTRVLIANDNNYPFDSARVAGTPDGNELDVFDLPSPVGLLAADVGPTPVVPEAPLAVLLPLVAAAAGALVLGRRRRVA